MVRGGVSVTREKVVGDHARVRTLRLVYVEVMTSWDTDRPTGRRDWSVSLAVTIGPLRGRTMVAYGVPPGSRIGGWITRGGFSGRLRGVNLRVGRRYVGPTLTWLAHGRVKEVWQ